MSGAQSITLRSVGVGDHSSGLWMTAGNPLGSDAVGKTLEPQTKKAATSATLRYDGLWVIKLKEAQPQVTTTLDSEL
jgi:hypothetical protein